jgi:hypothetical protein
MASADAAKQATILLDDSSGRSRVQKPSCTVYGGIRAPFAPADVLTELARNASISTTALATLVPLYFKRTIAD